MEASTSHLDSLPPEIIDCIDANLSFDDTLAFMESNAHVAKALKFTFAPFDQLQLSDDDSECFVSESQGKRRKRAINSVHKLFEMPNSITEVTIMLREVNLEDILTNPTKHSVFAPGGYLFSFLGQAFPLMEKVKSLNLHVDMMLENFKNPVPCPVEDLFFALHYLSTAPFETYIQISLCCAEYRDTDLPPRNVLIGGMEQTLKAATQRGAVGQFVVEPIEGYVDITVQKANVEYSFAFFYYNPTICEAAEDDTTEPLSPSLSPPPEDSSSSPPSPKRRCFALPFVFEP